MLMSAVEAGENVPSYGQLYGSASTGPKAVPAAVSESAVRLMSSLLWA